MPQATLRTKSGEFERTVIERVQEIIKLSIEVTDAGKAHVFVYYMGHTHQLDIQADPTTKKYEDDENIEPLMDKTIYLAPFEREFNLNSMDFSTESKAKIITELDKVINKLKTL